MLSRQLIKEILIDQRKDILQKSIGISREILEEIQKKIKLPHIIFISGLRRSGKSILLRQIIHEFYQDESFYYINFEDERLLKFEAQEFNQLYEISLELFGEKKTFFLDEIQNVSQFESFVRRFYDSGFKFYITGSSANLLQSELATKLTGRYLTTFVKPFSFTEFLRLKKVEYDEKKIFSTESRIQIKKMFDLYFENGGMPEYVIYEDSEILYRIYQDVLYKDIISRHGGIDMSNLRDLAQYLISNVSKKFSYNHLRTMLKIQSVTTIKNYCDYLEETCLCNILKKYTPSVKTQIVNDKKFYLIDNGFIRKISTSGTKDLTYSFENLILTTLWGIGTIFYYSNSYECDFLVMRENKILEIYQVCYILTLENRTREITGLIETAKILKLSSGMIITYDQEEEFDQEGIQISIIPAWRWMIIKASSFKGLKQ